MRKIGIILFVFLSSLSLSVYAQTVRYVSDDLEIPARAGSGDRFRITKSLKTGLKVQVLEENKTTGYSLVKTDNNYQGWVLTRQLMNEPSARNFIEEARTQYEPVRQKLTELEAELLKSKDKEMQLLEQMEVLKSDTKKSEEQLAEFKKVNSNAIEISKENTNLNNKNKEQDQMIRKLEMENQKLKDSNNNWEQMIGAGIFLFGMILGLVVIPRLLTTQRRKRNRDYL